MRASDGPAWNVADPGEGQPAPAVGGGNPWGGEHDATRQRRSAGPHREGVLSRYSIVRGAKASTLPRGLRQDTRKHTRHVLRPTAEMVTRLLARPQDEEKEWRRFATAYRSLLAERFVRERERFDALAELARTNDVLLGCNCPTAKNPDVRHCHTVLALAFMKAHYPELEVRPP